MKVINIKKIFSVMFFTLGVMILMSSCIKEDNDDCHKSCLLSVRVLDADNSDLTTSGVVKDIDLYVYDENGNFLEKSTITPEDVKNEKSILLNYHTHKSITVLAWANLAQRPLNYDKIQPTHTLGSKLNVTLKQDANGMHQSPGELFFGKKEIIMEEGIGSFQHELVVKRKTSSIYIITKRLRQWAAMPGDDYWYKVVGTKDSYDMFAGALQGNDATFKPSCGWDGDKDVLIAPIFDTFPSGSGQNVEVQIYKGDQCIYRASTDNRGLAFKAEEGKTLQIVIDFTAAVSVNVYINPWHSVQQITDL